MGQDQSQTNTGGAALRPTPVADAALSVAGRTPGATGLFAQYDRRGFFCEYFRADQPADPAMAAVRDRLASFNLDELRRRARSAEAELFNLGITFTVYSDRAAIDRVLPFDLIPRMLQAAEWDRLAKGVAQRVTAINRFLHDIYHDGAILHDGVVPQSLVLDNPNYRPMMKGFAVPLGVYTHIAGIDLVRNEQGGFVVLEDNVRTPSGVAYVIENRHMTLRVLPDVVDEADIEPVDQYGARLRAALSEIAPTDNGDPQIVLLSPGIYNAAYFEHVFLAREMGVPLVEGRDLGVDGGRVYMRTVAGPRRVHVIYRRIDDDFLDPAMFRPDSALGVPGLMDAWRRGTVAIANAVGAGVADDKAVYAYMPRIIEYYLGEAPILGNVPTHVCAEPDGYAYTRDHLHELVVKPVGASGGYGLLVGPHASRDELDEFRRRFEAEPANYISQPMIGLSVAPTLSEDGIAACHVDLRPFAITGRSTWVLPGGLSRVALKHGSIVVNSSQGGGSKDTWVLRGPAGA